MKSVPKPATVSTFRASREVCTELLRRGAKVREAMDLGELILATRYVRRYGSTTDYEEIADLMGLTRSTYTRRRARIRELTGVNPEDFPIDIDAVSPPAKIALGLAQLA